MSRRRNFTPAQSIWKRVRLYRTLADAYDDGVWTDGFFVWRPEQVPFRVDTIRRGRIIIRHPGGAQ